MELVKTFHNRQANCSSKAQKNVSAFSVIYMCTPIQQYWYKGTAHLIWRHMLQNELNNAARTYAKGDQKYKNPYTCSHKYTLCNCTNLFRVQTLSQKCRQKPNGLLHKYSKSIFCHCIIVSNTQVTFLSHPLVFSHHENLIYSLVQLFYFKRVHFLSKVHYKCTNN